MATRRLIGRRAFFPGIIMLGSLVFAPASPAQELLLPRVAPLVGPSSGGPPGGPANQAAPEPRPRVPVARAWAALDQRVVACLHEEFQLNIRRLIAQGVAPTDPRVSADLGACERRVAGQASPPGVPPGQPAAPAPAVAANPPKSPEMPRASVPAVAKPPVSAPDTVKEAELLFWQSVKDSKNPADFEEYLRQYPSGMFAGLARNHLAANPAAGSAQPPGRRVALVIGNASYKQLGRLDNTARDAMLIATTLKGLGFEIIGDQAQLDLDRFRFVEVVVNFGNKLAGADVGIFYFAGHGVQIRNENFLVPVDANPGKPSDADTQLVSAQMILRQMEDSGAKLKVVLLDACRNNPLGAASFRDSAGGLAQMRAPQGTLISYATQPGNTARDGEPGGDSPYTLALSQALQMKGVDVLRMFNNVGVLVANSTGHTQQPWIEHSPIQGEYYFAGR